MAKSKVQFVCTDCGAEFAKWSGQCSECKAWNTITEFRPGKATVAQARKQGFAGQLSSVAKLSEVSLDEKQRIATGIGEFDRVLGGGLVPGSAVLIGGHPGAGKSTILLQTTCRLAAEQSVLYVTGEESLQQVAMRAKRLRLPTEQLHAFAETSVEQILQTCNEVQPKILVIDSIQVVHVETVESAPGSVSQVREAAALLTQYAKATGTVLLLVGHVTKDGSLAGPKVLEHMIDASVMLESSGDSRFRTLRAIKNRFGAVNELGVFAMMEYGLKEVANPSAIFLNQHEKPAPGSLVTIAWEGTRPILIELQALVDESHYGNPKRVTVGLDTNRLTMLLAVLNRHAGVFTGDQDVFINLVGGMRVNETSSDLAMLLAVLSSLRDKPLDQQLCVFGEVGLSGEIRPVPNGQERLKEAAKHGFTHAIVPKGNMPKQGVAGLTINAVTRLDEALSLLR